MPYKIKAEKPYCNSPLESSKLEQYLAGKSRLVFTEFNTTSGYGGKVRALDAIRFPEMENGIFRSKDNYDNIRSLIANSEVERIEVHRWGFYDFGQIVGKSE